MQVSKPPGPGNKPQTQPAFVSGSLLRHILVMTGTATVGLIAIFAGDLVNMLFLSMLDDVEVVAAVGYASPLLFITVSVGIGLSIAGVATVSPALGANDRATARRYSASVHTLTIAVTAFLAVVVWIFAPWLLDLLGAKGRTAELATEYLRIQLPAIPALSVGMTSAAVLRCVGDAKRAMHITLAGAAVNVALDPIFIFALDLGLHGAALASAISRFAILGIGLYAVIRIHDLLGRLRIDHAIADIGVLSRVALPAILTNIATPISNAYVTAAFAPFGDDAVAGWAVISRLMPVAFGFMFALSGAIGPIVGQNYGAREYDRMERSLGLSLLVVVGYTLLAWGLLAALSPVIVTAFNAQGDTARLIYLFCLWLAPLFGMLGTLFVANAVFNTLKHAHYATLLNWGRATLGTVPFVMIGGEFAGADGVLAGYMSGGLVFGVLGSWFSYRFMRRIVATSHEQSPASTSPTGNATQTPPLPDTRVTQSNR